MNKNYNRVSYDVILQARSGSKEEIERIKLHFQPYIVKNSLRFVTDSSGTSHLTIDEILKNQLEIRLLNKILSFKIT
ncbi:TPA: helix-turn-helix domain-containing protein [Listeria monocytogenes]